MAYNNDKSDPMNRAVVRWVNKREIFKTVEFDEYRRNPDYMANQNKGIALDIMEVGK